MKSLLFGQIKEGGEYSDSAESLFVNVEINQKYESESTYSVQ